MTLLLEVLEWLGIAVKVATGGATFWLTLEVYVRLFMLSERLRPKPVSPEDS